jgi:hypothetical protein
MIVAASGWRAPSGAHFFSYLHYDSHHADWLFLDQIGGWTISA